MDWNLNNRNGLTIVLILVCFTIFNPIYAQTPSQSVPIFNFCTLDHKPFTNKDLPKGKKLLFLFFDVTCDHCQQAVSALNKRVMDCNNISVYLISQDNKLQINIFLNQFGSNLSGKRNVTILQDCKYEFIKIFGPRKYPSVFIYSSAQKLLLYDDEDLQLEKFFKIILEDRIQH